MKHLKSFVLSTFALYLLLTAFGCGKEKIVPLYTVSPDFLAYCYFQKGSYWIYEQDSFPGNVDSVYVLGNLADTVESTTARPKYTYEQFTYSYSVRSARMIVRIYTDWYENPTLLMQEMDTSSNYSAYHLFYNTSFDSIDDGTTKITSRLDTFTINKVKYHDLIQVTHSVSIWGNPTREILFAKGVGVVRRSFWDGTTWSLKRYHLE